MKTNWTDGEVLPTETGFFGTGKINCACSRVKILSDLQKNVTKHTRKILFFPNYYLHL